jgi:hypothetical protein
MSSTRLASTLPSSRASQTYMRGRIAKYFKQFTKAADFDQQRDTFSKESQARVGQMTADDGLREIAEYSNHREFSTAAQDTFSRG